MRINPKQILFRKQVLIILGMLINCLICLTATNITINYSVEDNHFPGSTNTKHTAYGTFTEPTSDALDHTLLQFPTACGHILGFMQNSLIVASPVNMLKISWVGANRTKPLSSNTHSTARFYTKRVQTFQ